MQHVSNRFQQRNVLSGVLSAILTISVGALLSTRAQAIQEAQSGAPANDPAGLVRQRAQEFYTLVQTRQFTKAEPYATKDSRERLRDQISNPFLGFRIVSALVNADGKTAAVTVELTVMAPYMGAPTPVQRNTQWLLEDGEWRIFAPEPPPNSSLEGMMAMVAEKKAKPEELEFRGHSYNFGDIKVGEVKTAAFPFTNKSDHLVTISQISTGCDCLKVKTKKMEYKPGESGEVVIDFDSANYKYEYVQTIVVKTHPDDITSYLQIQAQVIPPEPSFPKPKDGSRSSDSPSQPAGIEPRR